MSEYLLHSRHCSRGWGSGNKQGLLRSAFLDLMSWWAQTLVVSLGYEKFHRLGGLHSKYLFLTALGWEIWGHGASMGGFWWGSSFRLTDSYLFAVSSDSWERERDDLAPVSSNKGTNPIHEGSTLTANYLPKSPSPNTITWHESRPSKYEFWEDTNV